MDVISQVIGGWGRWQLRTVLLIYLCKIPSAWFMACIIYTAPTPRYGEFFCRPSSVDGGGGENHSVHGMRTTDSYALFGTSHAAEPGLDMDFCRTYDDYNGTGIPCEEFEHAAGFNSLVTQFDLVCSKTILIAVTQFFHLFGVLTGGILAVKLINL